MVGLTPEDATTAADVSLYAQLAGLESHGLVHLPLYVTGLIDGTIRARPDLRIHRNGSATAHIDAGHGLGLVVSHIAMNLAIDLAGEHGLGAVAVRNSSHFGAAGYYGDLAARQGMIGIAMSNSAPAIAPTGGVTALLGTNPIGVGIPLGATEPMVLDMATSTVARSRIRQSLAAGHKEIPAGWALDATGNPTTDAASAIAGSVMPIGGPKGFGLAALVEFAVQRLAGCGTRISPSPTKTSSNARAASATSSWRSIRHRSAAPMHLDVARTTSHPSSKPAKARARRDTRRACPAGRAQDARRASLATGIPIGPALKAALVQTADLLETKRGHRCPVEERRKP